MSLDFRGYLNLELRLNTQSLFESRQVASNVIAE